ncbi:MAG: hypothetical protein NTX64_02015 [Elusimicrobia bacterium]|nr:hypothetical protein [Elusimicrobiota bacterium]
MRELLRAALRLADLSRREILRRAERPKTRLKRDSTIVTAADLAAERALRAAIARRFPDHGIIGEEFAAVRPRAEFQWIIDPIDGTISFSHGIPFYGTVLGLHRKGQPLVGVIDLPGMGLRYSAAAGLGAFKNGARLRLNDLGPKEDIRREVLATGDSDAFERCGARRGLERLHRCHPHVRAYADCLGHGLVAQGSVAAMADFGIRLWDLAATQIIIEEAGGLYHVAHRHQDRDATRYCIIFGKPRAVRWLERFFD